MVLYIPFPIDVVLETTHLFVHRTKISPPDSDLGNTVMDLMVGTANEILYPHPKNAIFAMLRWGTGSGRRPRLSQAGGSTSAAWRTRTHRTLGGKKAPGI